jgi:hypothetical protein
MDEENLNELFKGFMATLSIFNKGFQTICNENEELTTEQATALTKVWWDGMMVMAVGKTKEE